MTETAAAPNLFAMVLHFRSAGGADVAGSGRQAHGLFHALVAERDPALAAQLHETSGVRPFTLSQVLALGAPAPEPTSHLEGQVYRLRVTLLNGKLFNSIANRLVGAPSSEEYRIGASHFALSEALVTPGSHAWAGFTSFGALLANAATRRELSFEFASPTAFGFGDRPWGTQVVVLPEPTLIFRNLLAKWNAFSSVPISPNVVDVVEKSVVVARHAIRTEVLRSSDAPQVGFVGHCTVEIKGKPDESAIRSLNALADFAFYAGIGRKTTMGMGQARRVVGGLPRPPKGGNDG